MSDKIKMQDGILTTNADGQYFTEIQGTGGTWVSSLGTGDIQEAIDKLRGEGWDKDADSVAQVFTMLQRKNTDLLDELSACTESPGGCGYWREAARHREAERDGAQNAAIEYQKGRDAAIRKITALISLNVEYYMSCPPDYQCTNKPAGPVACLNCWNKYMEGKL